MAKYYGDLAKKDDYYSSDSGDKEPPGYWLGGGAVALDLYGEVSAEQLQNGFTGYHPQTGEQLAKNAGESHKPGWDCTYSAPKTVSAIWAVADAEMKSKIEAAHQKSVAFSVDYLEREAAATRHGKDGHVRVAACENGGLVVAVFQHSTSRNQDPQLHSHCLVLNMNRDGRGIDLDTSHKMAVGALYRTELAHQLKEIGFEIERDDKSFKVAGVPEALVEQWSSRRTEILIKMAEAGTSGSSAAQQATLETRTKKSAIDKETLTDKWASQAREHGFDFDKVNQLADRTNQVEKLPEQPKDGVDIVNELTVQNATFTKIQALHQTALDGQGKLSGQQTLDRAELVLSVENGAVSLGIVTRDQAAASNQKSGDRYTTEAVLKMEKEMLLTAGTLAQKEGFEVDQANVKEFAQTKGLSVQQTAALEHLTKPNHAAVLQGWAGAGKSYLLDAARQSWQAEGFEVRGASLSNAAAQNLQSEAGIKSTSIAKLQFDLAQGDVQLTNKTVLVLDEAGMVGTRQMADLVQKCEQAGAKIVLVGDTNQLQPIEAGAAMRAIGERIGIVELNEVRRQTNQIDKDIAADFRFGRAGDALQKIDDLGRLKVEKNMDVAQDKAVANFLKDRDEGKISLLIAATRAEVSHLNQKVRAELQASGSVSREQMACPTSQGYRNFSEGDRVVFGQKHNFGGRGNESKTVINGSTGTVSQAFEDDGKPTLTVTLDKSGQTVKVDLTEFSKIDHGYATTAHKSQGATVDKVHAVIGEQTGKEWSYVAASRNRESVQIYTTADHYQRAEKGIEKVISDLEKGMAKSQAKDFAIDYKAAEKEPDFER